MDITPYELPWQMQQGTLIKRYKRFLADVTLPSGETIVAHCANTGSMATCGSEGDTVLLSFHDDPKRKLKYSWQFTKNSQGYIGINTAMPNKIVEHYLREGLFPSLQGFDELKTEQKYGKNSRIDILLQTHSPSSKCYVEVKNVTLFGNQQLLFPDAKTTRGQKHLQELMDIKKENPADRAVMFYFINRPEGETLSFAKDIDPIYAELATQAHANGVEFLAYRFQPKDGQMICLGAIPIAFGEPH